MMPAATTAPRRRARASGQHPLPPGRLPRLVPPDGPLGLAAHLSRYGPLPLGVQRGVSGNLALIDSLERSGLTGRGGAGFPVARKLRTVAAAGARPAGLLGRPGTVVVANGVDSEPASGKDRILLTRAPHLVLDGIALAAEAVAAGDAYLCVPAGDREVLGRLARAVSERAEAAAGEPAVQVVGIPDGYVSSEETSLVSYLNGGAAVPMFVPPRPFQRGVSGRPTLVSNVETLAHLALIGRFGAAWFASAGSTDAPGSSLVTIGGAVGRPGVYEISLGTPIGELIEQAGGASELPQAVLAGGFFGGWLRYPAAADVPASGPGLRAAGAAFGPGILCVLPQAACGLAETARIVRYLAGQSAGQCGPCVNGLPAIADMLEKLAWRGRGDRALAWLQDLLPLVDGRGACHFPDGAVALTASALRVFSEDLDRHRRHGPCHRVGRAPVLPVPRRRAAAEHAAAEHAADAAPLLPGRRGQARRR